MTSVCQNSGMSFNHQLLTLTGDEQQDRLPFLAVLEYTPLNYTMAFFYSVV